jgi:hypothetical protein
MGKIKTLNGVENENILDDIFNNEIIVHEDIQASKIWVNWDGDKFSIKPKSINNDVLNLIDLSLQNYYNPAINYFNNFDKRVKGLMPKKWWFCFEFFPDQMPANIEYQRMPKNGLVLTTISKSGKFEYSLDELDEYTRLFNVDKLPIIFQGRLSDDMKEAITYFINTSEEDLQYVFGESSFAYFFYKILNPNSTNSFLMEDRFQENLEKIVIKLKDKDLSFQILNPLYQRVSEENSTEFTEIYTLILVNFLTFCQTINLEDVKIKGKRRDELYMYISEVKDDLINFDFTVPQFFDKEKFKINVELIPNKLTKEFIEENSKLEYIFKVVLGSFNKKKKKPIGIFTENTVIIFNKFVDDIQTYLDNTLNKVREVQFKQAGLLDFGQFFDIEYDTDASGDVYPQVWDEIESGSEDKKGKKGKFKK